MTILGKLTEKMRHRAQRLQQDALDGALMRQIENISYSSERAGAIRQALPEITRLLGAGANPNRYTDGYALYQAARPGTTTIAGCLLTVSAGDLTLTQLEPVIHTLFEHGANPHAKKVDTDGVELSLMQAIALSNPSYLPLAVQAKAFNPNKVRFEEVSNFLWGEKYEPYLEAVILAGVDVATHLRRKGRRSHFIQHCLMKHGGSCRLAHHQGAPVALTAGVEVGLTRE